MAEPSKKDTARLGEKLIAIGSVLRDAEKPPARDPAAVVEVWPPKDAVVGKDLNTFLFLLNQKLMPVIRKLEQRIEELEQRPTLEDGGIWNERAVYRPGQVVTRGGSAFVCRQANSNTRPGESDCWRLMVQRGRDGKDARGNR